MALLQDNLGDPDRTLLIVDGDAALQRRLGRAMGNRGFEVDCVCTARAARQAILSHPPAHAIFELRLEDGSGLELIELLHRARSDSRIVVHTGFAAIASAVAAVKCGAQDYLTKPACVDDLTDALIATKSGKPALPERPMSADRVRWEYIQRVLEQCDRNVSETARRLSMHRRTLQRILSKNCPR